MVLFLLATENISSLSINITVTEGIDPEHLRRCSGSSYPTMSPSHSDLLLCKISTS